MVFQKLWLLIALFVLIPTAALAMTSTNYQILWDSVNSGGADLSTSTNYTIRDTIGEHATGLSESENYRINAGYRVGDVGTPFISFSIGTKQSSTSTAWTAFSNNGNTVTVSATSSFSVDDYIGVVEDEGFAQLLAIGKITSISGSDITVDNWEGDAASLSASPTGTNDIVYAMNGTTAPLGIVLPPTEAVSMTMTDVVTNATNGYTVTIQADGDLDYASTSIQNVSDGTVDVDSEEYGAEVIGTFAVGAGSDLLIPSSTTRTIQQSSEYGTNDRVAVIYKLSVDDITAAGDYEQVITYRLTASF